MKELTDSERLEIAEGLLGKRELDIYVRVCEKRELGCPDGYCDLCQQVECGYPDPSDPQANGFHNVPAECENFECRNCTMIDQHKREIDCPYVEEDNDG